MARSVRVVTDSTSDLKLDYVEAWGITVAPLTVQFGDDIFRDGVDITPSQFYARLAQAEELPRTSQPSPAAFQELFQKLIDDDHDVVVIVLSATLSGTYNVARLVAQQFPPDRIRVVDSKLVTMGLALVVRKAALLAQAGGSLDDVDACARQAANQATFLAMIDTLEYLYKGGRIGRLSAFLGGLLSVKPLLTMRDGHLVPLERVRTQVRGLDRLVQLLVERQPFDGPLLIGHSHSPGIAEQLRRLVERALPGIEMLESELGPVVGVYSGPGAVGVALLRDE